VKFFGEKKKEREREKKKTNKNERDPVKERISRESKLKLKW
jgi:hypothetical protein